MTTKIEINNLRVYAYHGVLEQERKVGNYFEVSLCIDYPFERALTSDDLNDTLNYAAVCDLVVEEMAIPSELLEHVAGRIIRRLQMEYSDIIGGCITIAKLNPPIPHQLRSCAITVEW